VKIFTSRLLQRTKTQKQISISETFYIFLQIPVTDVSCVPISTGTGERAEKLSLPESSLNILIVSIEQIFYFDIELNCWFRGAKFVNLLDRTKYFNGGAISEWN
jgi:hypothetical protein